MEKRVIDSLTSCAMGLCAAKRDEGPGIENTKGPETYQTRLDKG